MTRANFRSRGPAPLLAVGLLLLAAPLQAGPIFIPGQLEGNQFTSTPGVPRQCYTIRFSTSTVSVEKDAAKVEVEEVIDGPEQTIPAICLIPLPDGVNGASIRVSWGKTGTEPKILGDATFLDSAKAQAMYETIARGGLTKILAFTGRPAILVPTIDLGGKGKISITFRMEVKSVQGVHMLTCPMPAASFAAAPVERVTVNVNLTNKQPLRSIFSPTHTTSVTRKNPTEATVTAKADRWTGLDDFRLYWAADTDALGLRVLAYRAKDKEDGYFMLLGNPLGGVAAAERAVLKDVIFVMDTSGSMRGEKIEQARAALDYCIQHLDRTDRFNIVTFGTDVKTFKNDLVDVTPENLKGARAFVEDVIAHGQTNISGALQKALSGKAAEGRERIMIFVTDGAPTIGERSPEKILEQVKKQNNGTRIFVMGVGNDVNAHLLDQMAELTDGSSEFFAPKEELDAKVAALYDRLSHPVLSSVKVSFGESGARQILPSKVPVLFKGSEIMMVGRYKQGGKHTFTIAGTLAGQPVQYTCEVNLPKEAGGANEFLPPLWAARQIGYLLQEIRLRGANKELIEEVVRLSKQYGIVTEHTEFIAAAGPSAKAGELYAEAGKRLNMARNEQAGQWAVNQAFNDRQLQTRAVAGAAANTYRDRRGKETTFDNINLIGQRAFYLQDGQWVDAEEAGTRKTRVVKILSPEYFDLLKNDSMFAKAQQLGWALSINVGAERIVVEKDGKQKDESLIPKAEELAPGPGGPNRKRGFEQNQLPFPDRNRNQLERPNGGPNQRPIPPLQQNLPPNGKQQDRDQ